MKMLNLGCGSRYHPEWVNCDIASSSPDVISHNILDGIPFAALEFDVVYHSHLLEHLTRTQGEALMRECFRVLKERGIIRVVVPDLEAIARSYLEELRKALDGDDRAGHNYDWVMLEMYDQTVREKTGGEMVECLRSAYLPNEDFILDRSSELIRGIRASWLAHGQPAERTRSGLPRRLPRTTDARNALKVCTGFAKRLVLGTEFDKLEIARFRTSGEVHKWMYDRYSLSRLLSRCGFACVELKTASASAIPKWEQYELDAKNGVARKPNSVFMEGLKPG